jgi:acetyltransferase-like isoleucine patch superfamily enzyme
MASLRFASPGLSMRLRSRASRCGQVRAPGRSCWTQPAAGSMNAPALRRAWRIGGMRVRAANGRVRLAWLSRLHPGLRVDASASPCFGVARISLAPDGRLTIGANAATEYRPGLLNLVVHDGAEIVLEPSSWLRTEVGAVNLVAFAGARIVVGSEVMLNACSVSAQREVVLERRATVGPGSRIHDFTHDLDEARPGSAAPVRIGAHAWIASDVTVLPGVAIGAHCVIGARSVVTRDVPPHTLAFGAPAVARGSIGDRTRAR